MTKQEKQDIRFSIIIPAYNAEQTLSRLTDTICAQTFSPSEVILVDDCSTDRTGQVADQIAGRNNARIGTGKFNATRWRVIHKTVNEGLPSARNTGLKYASGDWVLFWDSDDIVEKNLLESVMEVIRRNKEADIVVYSIYEDFINSDGQLQYSNVHKLANQDLREGTQYFTEKADLVQKLEKGTLYGYAWNKAYNREFLLNNQICFQKIPFIEDILFNIRCFDKAAGISVLQQPLYHYINQESDRLTGKYISEYFDLQKKRYVEFLKQQARWLCSGRENLQELKQSFLGQSALELISGRYFRSFSSWISRELSHGTKRSEIETTVRKEFEHGDLYSLLSPYLPDLGMSGRFLYLPLQKGNAKQAIRHADTLNWVRNTFPSLYNRLKQNR